MARAAHRASWPVKKPDSADRSSPVKRRERRQHTHLGVLGCSKGPCWHDAWESRLFTIHTEMLACSRLNRGKRTGPRVLGLQTLGLPAYAEVTARSHLPRPLAWLLRVPETLRGPGDTLIAAAQHHAYLSCPIIQATLRSFLVSPPASSQSHGLSFPNCTCSPGSSVVPFLALPAQIYSPDL